jgi:3-oxoadipate enol-lactonase
MPEAMLNGARIYYQEHGPKSAPPLILAHGLGGNHTMWAFQVPALKRKYRLILWDCRGHGRSEVTDNGYSIGQFVDDQYALLQHLGIQRAHIGGLSMGGWIAWSFAVAHPEATNALVLSDAAGYLNGMGQEWLTDKRNLFAASAKVVMEKGRAPLADVTINLMFSPEFIKARPDIIGPIRAEIAADPGVGYARTVEQMFLSYWQAPPLNVNSQLASITAPTLIIVGEVDQLTPVPTQQALARAIPNARLEIIPGSGHVPPIEQPELWNRLVMEFIEKAQR